MTTAEESLKHIFEACLPFASNEEASAVTAALSADAELRPEHVSRSIVVEDNILKVTFRATEARLLKSAVGTFLELAALAAATIERFGTVKE
eukprot:g5658.t1